MSATDAKIHAAQDLIHALQNPAPASPLVTLAKFTQRSIDIPSIDIWKSISTSNTSEDASQGGITRKLQQVNQEVTRIKNASQSKRPFTKCITSEGDYCGGIPTVTPTGAPSKKTIKFQPRKNSAVIPRKREISKNENR